MKHNASFIVCRYVLYPIYTFVHGARVLERGSSLKDRTKVTLFTLFVCRECRSKLMICCLLFTWACLSWKHTSVISCIIVCMHTDAKESEKKVNRNDSQSSHSTLSSESASPQLRHNKQKNRKSELVKRQSMFAPTEVRANVAGIEKPDCTLIGYRKLNSNSLAVTSVPVVELGTLQSDETEPPKDDVNLHSTLHNAVSVPFLHGRSQLNMSVSGSMPDLTDKTSSSFAPKLSGTSAPNTGSEPSLSKNSSNAKAGITYLGFKKMVPGENLGSSSSRGSNGVGLGYLPEVMKSGDLMESILLEVSKNGECSSSTSASNNAMENGYLSSRSSDLDKSPLGDSDENTTGVSVRAASEQLLINKHRIAQMSNDESPNESEEASENPPDVVDLQMHNGSTPTAWGEVSNTQDVQDDHGVVNVSSIDLSEVSNATDSLRNNGTTAEACISSKESDNENRSDNYTVNELLKEEMLLSQRNNVLSQDVTCTGDASVTEANVLPALAATPASKKIGMAHYSRQLHSTSQTSLTTAKRRPYSMIATSASNPELSSSLEAYRLPEKLVSPVNEAIVT